MHPRISVTRGVFVLQIQREVGWLVAVRQLILPANKPKHDSRASKSIYRYRPR